MAYDFSITTDNLALSSSEDCELSNADYALVKSFSLGGLYGRSALAAYNQYQIETRIAEQRATATPDNIGDPVVIRYRR